MDQAKIGRFIAECRKNANLTQMQLAEKLNITDRAISKWETGKSLPDSSVMLELCSILKITVNDLLSGEVVTMENYNKEMENKLIELVKQKEENDRRLLMLEWVIGILSCIILFVPIFIGSLVPLEDWKKIVLVFSGFIPGVVGLCFAMRIEQIAGYYACKHCKHKYVPTFKAISFAPHMGRTRYMKCPECGRKSWQKKVISKD
ncbi:MAG: helix-turn-helix transcriptional regulator [Clostridia bacterium]|nr:helix-turn-helix transcriptional regulator [Clostridia bacterium]